MTELDKVYEERNRCVAVVAALALRLGYDAWVGEHEGDDWDDEWRTVIYVNLPTGQVSWHVHDNDRALFDHLPSQNREWDGHTTEEKYDRCRKLCLQRVEAKRMCVVCQVRHKEHCLNCTCRSCEVG